MYGSSLQFATPSFRRLESSNSLQKGELERKKNSRELLTAERLPKTSKQPQKNSAGHVGDGDLTLNMAYLTLEDIWSAELHNDAWSYVPNAIIPLGVEGGTRSRAAERIMHGVRGRKDDFFSKADACRVDPQSQA